MPLVPSTASVSVPPRPGASPVAGLPLEVSLLWLPEPHAANSPASVNDESPTPPARTSSDRRVSTSAAVRSIRPAAPADFRSGSKRAWGDCGTRLSSLTSGWPVLHPILPYGIQSAMLVSNYRPRMRAMFPPSTSARSLGSSIALAIFIRSRSKSWPGYSVPITIFSAPTRA